MGRYRSAGAAVVRCGKCGAEFRVEWKAGDAPIYSEEIEDHHMGCSGDMVQLTHNDGKTPLSEPCPADCCL